MEEKHDADLLLTHYNQVFCPNSLGHPLFRSGVRKLREVLKDGYIAVKDGKNLSCRRSEKLDAGLIGWMLDPVLWG